MRVPGATAALALGGVGLAVAYGLTGPAGWSDTGPRLVVEHLFSLLSVLALFVLAGATGGWALRLLRFPLEGPAETVVFSVAAGAGILGTAILVLAAIGLLHTGLVWVLLILSAAPGWRTMRGGALRFESRRPRPDDSRLLAAGAVLVLAVVGVFLVAQALLPPGDWDTLMYHLRIPSQLLVHGGLFLPEDNLHVTRIGLAHMLYVPLLGIGVETAPALVSAVFALLTGVAGWALCDRFFGRRVAWLGLMLVWGGTAVLMVAVTPRVDMTVAFYTFVAHYAVLVALERPHPGEARDDRGIFLVAGALLGLAVGVKLQALVYAVALGPVLLWALFRGPRPVLHTAYAAAAFLALAAPWLIKNVALVGAPLYPVLAAPRLEPWLARLYGRSGFPSDVDPRLTLVIWELRERLDIVDFFLHPGRLAIEREARYYYGNPILLLLPLAAFVRPRRVIAATVAPAVLYLVGLLLLLPEANPRYLIPGLVPLSLIAAFGALRASERLRPRVGRPLLLMACVTALLPTARTIRDPAIGTAAALRHAIGARSRAEAVRKRWGASLQYLVTAFPAEASLREPGTRTLMLFEARGFYFAEDVIQDNRLLNWPLLVRSPGFGPGWCPADAGFTHVLVNFGALDYYRRSGLDPERLGWPEFQGVEARCLATAARGFGIVLYRDTTTTGPSSP